MVGRKKGRPSVEKCRDHSPQVHLAEWKLNVKATFTVWPRFSPQSGGGEGQVE